MRPMLLLLSLTTGAGVARPMLAQSEPVTLAEATTQAKQKLGLIVYPARDQTPQQQATDEQACYVWAQQQIAPSRRPDADSAAKASRARADSATQGAAAKGAAGGAAGGALIGAAAGDAGKGAGVGALAGALRGRRARHEAEQQAEQQARAQAEARANRESGTLRKAMTACLQGRGYTLQ